MNDKWKPTEELNELQEELDCPDEFIYDFMEAIRNRWSPNGCHARVKKLKSTHKKPLQH